MEAALKQRYSFRLGTTSFIYPAGYESNVRQLAPCLDEIELLLFESDHLPPPNEIDALTSLAGEYGITYNVHLPMDIDMAAESALTRRQSIDAVARAIDRVAPLHPTTLTLHLTFNRSEKSNDAVAGWQQISVESMTRLLSISGIPSRRISIETLDFSPFWLKPVVETMDLAVCVDVGHVILYGFDLSQVIDAFAERTAILHIHGVAAGRDHLSLIHLNPDERRTISRYLQDFKGSVSIEVFNFKRLNESMAAFPELMNPNDEH